ncbi:MAG: sulfite exporter TauE/SafE family protein [Planctomycetaceae bacterium]|nr:MAG: sulfite exporter TauE/SafE family protein [Planctomycetaceae bacterium]
MTAMEVVLILIIVVVASTVGTLTGFGLSTIMIPVMVLFYPMPETLLFVGVIHWFSDLWKLLLFREGIRWRLILSFGIPGIVATILAARLLFSISGTVLARILGVFLIAYVVFLLTKSAFKVRQSPATAAIGGTLSGFSAGIFGMGGAIRALFLSAFDLPKAVYLATAGAIAIAIDTPRLATYVWQGARLEPLLLWGTLLFVPASFLGANLGKSLVNRIPERHFRKVIAAFLFIIGLKLLIHPA